MAMIESLKADLERVLGQDVLGLTERLGELTLVVKAGRYAEVCQALRDDASLRFDTLIDLCGLDYRDYGDVGRDGPRFAAVIHLLSVEHNHRLRLRAFCEDDDFRSLACGLPRAGSSAKPSICSALFSKVIPTCVAS
jgi:NADH-quinone oxidoreductase subunit C